MITSTILTPFLSTTSTVVDEGVPYLRSLTDLS